MMEKGDRVIFAGKKGVVIGLSRRGPGKKLPPFYRVMIKFDNQKKRWHSESNVEYDDQYYIDRRKKIIDEIL